LKVHGLHKQAHLLPYVH